MPVNIYFIVALGVNSALDTSAERTETDVLEKIAVLPGVLTFGSVRAADGSKAGLVSVADEAAREALKPQLDALPIRYNYVSIASLVKESAAAAKSEKKKAEPVVKAKKISATDLGVAPPPMAHAFGVTVANVVPSVTNKQLTSLLVGKVSEVMDVLRSEDMAVLYVPSEQDVVAAISTLNGSTLEGRVLNVSRGTACCIPVPLSQHQMMQMQMRMHYDAVSHLYAGPPQAHALMAPPAAGEFDPAPAAGQRPNPKFAQIASNAPSLPVEAGAASVPAAPAGAWAKGKLQDAIKATA